LPDHVAVTFDDGPDAASTPVFIEALADLDWKATFFMLGSMVDAHRSIAAEVVAAGHEVGVHGYAHRSHALRGPRAVVDDVVRARDVIADATGVAPRWFRPPYGTMSVGTLRAARAAGLRTVLWTTWGRDWRAEATGESVVDDVCANLGAGATVLLHDSDCTSAPESWRSTLEALPVLAQRFAAAGLRPGPLADHFA
jgi:peptidoglycan/xylan/chitin deacetylase (PgdA/CDA1 family)